MEVTEWPHRKANTVERFLLLKLSEKRGNTMPHRATYEKCHSLARKQNEEEKDQPQPLLGFPQERQSRGKDLGDWLV